MITAIDEGRSRMKRSAVLIVALLLAGCSKGSTPSSGSTTGGGGARVTARDLAAQIGCLGFLPDQRTELFVREQADCAFAEDASDTRPITIYVFTDATARDNWLNAASAVGTGPLVVGATWVIAVGTNCDPANPCSAEDRAATIATKTGGQVR